MSCPLREVHIWWLVRQGYQSLAMWPYTNRQYLLQNTCWAAWGTPLSGLHHSSTSSSANTASSSSLHRFWSLINISYPKPHLVPASKEPNLWWYQKRNDEKKKKKAIIRVFETESFTTWMGIDEALTAPLLKIFSSSKLGGIWVEGNIWAGTMYQAFKVLYTEKRIAMRVYNHWMVIADCHWGST